jgi:hypothetical protein
VGRAEYARRENAREDTRRKWVSLVRTVTRLGDFSHCEQDER